MEYSYNIFRASASWTEIKIIMKLENYLEKVAAISL